MGSQAIAHCKYSISMSICVAEIMRYCFPEAEKQLREKISILSRIIHTSTIKSMKIDFLKSSTQVTSALNVTVPLMH